MNTLLNSLKEMNNYKFTENGDLAYRSTMNGIMDLFAFGGAYRSRSTEDRILLFKKAFEEDETLALRCLFYLRDCRGGQGERKFFREVIHWLAIEYPTTVKRNLQYIPYFGRWDDLYCLVDTPLEQDVFNFMYHQLALDVKSKTPSLLAKWLKSENASSEQTRDLGRRTRMAFHMSAKEYRKTLSTLRERIRVLERLMSENRWDEIEFDKIPSKAGFIYRNAFARHDVERAAANKQTYAEFAKDTSKKVNADTLYPCEVVADAINCRDNKLSIWEQTDRLMINKYWDNLKDYFNNAVFNGVAVVDTSGSMTWDNNKIKPIDVAIALGMYCAEKCNPNSPWYGHYISFSSYPQLISIDGIDFVDKVHRIYRTNLCDNTNIENVFRLLLNTAIRNHVPQEEMPENIIIISDMEFDAAQDWRSLPIESVTELYMRKYKEYGYNLPHLIFWNVNARNDTIPMKDNGHVTFVSGYSASLFEQILSGKTSIDFVLDILNSDRYSRIY